MQKSFEKIIVRVYALIVHKGRILLSDEFWYDTPMTKFPGGGLELGEGIYDCLEREIIEELGVKPLEMKHFFTYDKLIASDFIHGTQVIPIYYLVQLKDYSSIDVSEYRYDFKRLENGAIRLRWINIDDLDEKELTFAGDKEVLMLFKKTTKALLTKDN